MSYRVRSSKRKILYQVCLSVVLVSAGISAAGQVKSATPDPAEIVSAAATAVQQIKSVSYNATFEAVFGPNGMVMRGRAEVERGGSADAALPARLHIKTDGYGGAQEVTFNGRIARRLVHEKKLLTEGLVAKGGITVARNSSALLILFWSLIEEEPLKYERAATSAEYLGLGSVDGVLCHVLDLKYEVPGTDVSGARWWFAVEDKLPRRFQKTLNTATGKTTQELRVSNLRLGNGISEMSFPIDLPSGYSYKSFVPGTPPKPISIGETAPDWMLHDASGKQHRLSSYRGRIVVLNFWASWCGYCKLGIPALQKIYEKYERRRVSVLGVSFQELEGVDPADYLKTRGADFPTLLKGETIAPSYGVVAVPAYYVIDQKGRVAYAILQHTPNVPAELEDVIETLLREQTKR